MTIDGVRLPADFLRLISEPFRRSGRADALGNRVIARHRAEFGLEIGLAVDAFARNPRIEEVGSKLDLGRRVGRERERAFEPMLADIAPRADDVRHDVDYERGGRRGARQRQRRGFQGWLSALSVANVQPR